MTHPAVTIQVDPVSVPSTPSWLEEVVAVAHVLTHVGVLNAIQDHVQFARARFGDYDTIDFVVVLLGYAISGEPTLQSFYERLTPFAEVFMTLFGRHHLPSRSALSRFLASLDQATVEALRTQFLEDLLTRTSPFPTPGGLWDRSNQQCVVVDVDGTRQAARQRALPQLPSLPSPHRRFDLVAAPGYKGRKRGEVVRTRTTLLQAHTHQFMGTFGGAGNGDYRAELKQVLQVLTKYATTHKLLPSQILVRLDGLYGDAAVLTDVLDASLGLIGRSRNYALLDLAEVQAVLARPPALVCTHPESGALRALYDCPDTPLTAGGPRVRLIVATHPAASASQKIGKKRDGMVYELFVTTLAAPAFSAKDVLDLYLHRGSFETVLADEDVEQDPDRWCSHTPCGQEFWQILNQWVWNLRMELGQHLSATPMHTTEFAPATKFASAIEPAPATEFAPTLTYGPPQWARRSFTRGYPGSAFTPQPDGSLLCLANHPLYPQERRPERDGSLRVLYAARIGDCRDCLVRAQCQENLLTIKPRRVSAVFWPIPSNQVLISPPIFGPPEPPARSPVIWGDWPRCHIRRNWLKVVRSETVDVTMGAAPTQDRTAGTDEHMMTREQRAHWRFSWEQRLARNTRPATAPSLTITIHGLPASFAQMYGFGLSITDETGTNVA
jgi:hypothetical protein